MPAEIIVRGECEVRVMPDHASIRVKVDGDGPSQEAAYDAAAELAAAVDAVLDAHAAELGRVVTASLIVQPTSRWKKGESQRTGWRASRSTLVEITDPKDVAGLIGQLARAGGAVGGTWWELDPAHAAHDEVRSGAAGDARRRAKAYAAGLGVELGTVAWIAEPGLRHGSGRGDMFGAGYPSVGSADGSPDDQHAVAVTAGEITLTATVEVGFELRQ